MLLRILRHEWRTLVADASPWVLLAVFAAAIGYATWNGTRWVAFQRTAIAEAQTEEHERFQTHESDIRLIAAGRKTVAASADPRNADVAGRRLATRYAVLPPMPLAPLAVGQSDLLPYYFRISTDAKEAALAASEIENPLRLLAGRFDLAFVLIYLHPLLALALAYNLLSGEKEQGTLALALSQPVALRTLALGKITLRLAVFVGAIVVLASVALVATNVDLTAPGAMLSLGLWVAAVAVYGLFWFAVAVVVASLGRPSSTNAAILAAVWLLFTVVLPSTLNLAANTAYPVPSRVALIQAMRTASDEANTRGSQLLAKYYEDHPELAPDSVEAAMNQASLIRMATNSEIETRVRPVLDTFDRQRAGQQWLIERLRFLSPALLMQDALNDISGTGTARHRAFMTQVAQFHETWRGYFIPRVFRNVQLAGLSDLPRFTFVEESPAALVGRVSLVLGTLLAVALIVATVGLRALRRYPVVGA